MNLDTFISESLTQILGGIATANGVAMSGKATEDANRPFLLKHGGQKDSGSGIEFDIAVTVKSEKTGKGSAKTRLLQVFDAELAASGSLANEQVSRIKFMVFVNQWQG